MKDLLIGCITGLLANVLGIFLYVQLLPFLGRGKRNFDETITHAINNNYIGKLVALGAVLNLIAFFLFLRKRQDQRAKGVLLITVVIGVATMIQKLI